MDPGTESVLFILGWRDALAVGLFFACMFGMTALIENPRARQQSVARLMAGYRADWMRVLARREMRIFDASLLAVQHQGTAFYASACMIAIGGMVALIGQTERLVDLARDLSDSAVAERTVWEIKLLFVLCLLVAALLKFIWAHRLFGYCAVLMGAVPHDGPEDRMVEAAEKAARINITAGRSFNRGLRILYFTLASLAWFLGPVALGIASLLVAAMLYRREFLSQSRRVLAGDEAP